jgi:hypothetical protein
MEKAPDRSREIQRHAAETGNTELSAKANEIWYDTKGKYGGNLSAVPWFMAGAAAVGSFFMPGNGKLKAATVGLAALAGTNHMAQNWRKEEDYKKLVAAVETKAQVNWALDERAKEQAPMFLRGNLGAGIPEDLM